MIHHHSNEFPLPDTDIFRLFNKNIYISGYKCEYVSIHIYVLMHVCMYIHVYVCILTNILAFPSLSSFLYLWMLKHFTLDFPICSWFPYYQDVSSNLLTIVTSFSPRRLDLPHIFVATTCVLVPQWKMLFIVMWTCLILSIPCTWKGPVFMSPHLEPRSLICWYE